MSDSGMVIKDYNVSGVLGRDRGSCKNWLRLRSQLEIIVLSQQCTCIEVVVSCCCMREAFLSAQCTVAESHAL